MVFYRRTSTGECIWIHCWRFERILQASVDENRHSIGQVKDEGKVNHLSSYAMNTIKASFPPTSDIGVQTFFSGSFSNRRDKKGIVNVNKISESAWGCIFLCIFLKRSWIYYLRHKDPKVSYCSNFSWSRVNLKPISLKQTCGFLSCILLYVTNIKTSESSCKLIYL